MRRLPLGVLAVLALASRPASAQGQMTLDRPPVGALVRVTAPPLPRMTATLAAFRGDTLVLLRPEQADTVRIALGNVEQLDVSLGRRRRVNQAVRVGLLVGGLVGAVGSAVAIKVDDGQGYEGLAFTAGTTAGVLAGGVIGAIVGAVPVQRWQRVEGRERSSRIRLLPTDGRVGTGMGLALSF